MICPKCGGPNAKKNGGVRGICPGRPEFEEGRGHTFLLPLEMLQEKVAEVLLARQGVAPEHDMTHSVAPGFQVKGVSTQYDRDGNISSQWVKTTRDHAAQELIFEAAVDALKSELPRYQPIAAPRNFADELMVGYPIGDPHIGMRAWAEECGDDWDLGIAERVHLRAMDSLVDSVPASKIGLVCNLGDALHYDSMEAKTPRSGHFLDADGRYAKMVGVAIKVMRRCIDRALTKHEIVIFKCVPGNHDETGALWLARAVAIAYENEPRVIVDTSPSVFLYHRFGKVLIGMHHGHTAKPAVLPSIMATDRPRDWGDTEFRYWWMGHIHHESKKEFNGCSVESFNTLASKDAYATNGGWRARESMQAIVYHEEFGEVARNRVAASMFRSKKAA
jgi:hypothetical protein